MGEISSVLKLPRDEVFKKQLEIKLEEYRSRLCGVDLRLQMQPICMIEVLQRLVREGVVETWKMAVEMHQKYRDDFDIVAFANACGVVEQVLSRLDEEKK